MKKRPFLPVRMKGGALPLLWALGWLLTVPVVAGAQDIHFSQFFEAPLLRNPSLAGLFEGDIRVQAVYRDQWNSVTTAYKTASLNGQYKVQVGRGNDFVTYGLQLLQDRAGAVSWVSTHVMPAFNYHKSLRNNRTSYLSLGVMGGWVQKRFDKTKMTTNSLYDGLGDGEPNLNPQFSYWDASVGLSYNAQVGANPANNYYLGVAHHHFHRPKNTFYRDPRIELAPRTDLSAGLRLGVTEWSELTLHGNHSFQNGFRETVFGGLYGLRLGPDPGQPAYTVHGGLLLRVNDALIPLVKVDYRPFAFSLSYDVNTSKLRGSTYGRGGFELGLSYTGYTERNNSTLNAVVCPRF